MFTEEEGSDRAGCTVKLYSYLGKRQCGLLAIWKDRKRRNNKYFKRYGLLSVISANICRITLCKGCLQKRKEVIKIRNNKYFKRYGLLSVISANICRITLCKGCLQKRKEVIKISRWKHRLGTGVAAGILAFMMSVTPAMAEPVSILDEVTETDADYAEDTSYSILKGNHLNFGTTKIAKLSSSKLAIQQRLQNYPAANWLYMD